MSRRALALTAAAALAGCSLIVPLDYTGGTEPSHGDHGGQGGTGAVDTGGFGGEDSGGTVGDAGFSEGGEPTEPEGGAGNIETGGTAGTAPNTAGDTASGTAGTTAAGNGGMTGGGGTADVGGGGNGGTDTTGGTPGDGSGGIAGGGGQTGGGGGHGGIGGMQGGMSGGGIAGNADCEGADLTSDPANCGSCGHACGSNQDCAEGTCISSPCDGICATWLTPQDNGDGPRKDPINTVDDQCVEVANYEPNPGYLPAFTCWNADKRKIQVNGVTMNCDSASHVMDVTKRKGGYCVHATPGDYAWAGWVMPYAPGTCCIAPSGSAGAGN